MRTLFFLLSVVVAALAGKVTAPAAGTTWTRATDVVVEWECVEVTECEVQTARIVLIPQKGGDQIVLATEEFDDGDFAWTIATKIPEGDYKVQVIPTGGFGPYDSDVFHIVKGEFGLSPMSKTWVLGETVQLVWEGAGVAGDATFELYNSNNTKVKTWTAPNADGQMTYNIPTSLDIDAYTLVLRAGTNTDTSDPFDIVGYITVTTPDAQTSWQRGSRVIIEWNAARPDDIGKVGIELYQGKGTRVSTITASSDNDGFYAWDIDVTLPPAKDYYLRIKEEDSTDHIAESDFFELAMSAFYIDSPQDEDELTLTDATCTILWENEMKADKFITCQVYEEGTLTAEWKNLKNTGTATVSFQNMPDAYAHEAQMTCFFVDDPSKVASVKLYLFDQLNVTKPEANEVWKRNNAFPYMIEWDTGIAYPGGTVAIKLWSEDIKFGNEELVITDGTNNDASFAWVPHSDDDNKDLKEGTYRIRIEDVEKGPHGGRVAYSAPFKIVPGDFALDYPPHVNATATIADVNFDKDVTDAHPYGSFDLYWEPGPDTTKVTIRMCGVYERMPKLDMTKCTAAKEVENSGYSMLNFQKESWSFADDYRMIYISQGAKNSYSIPFFVGPMQATAITAPTATTAWKRGTSQAITWTIDGNPNPAPWTTCTVQLKTDASSIDLNEADPEDDGLYLWDIPTEVAVGEKYWIAVVPDERWAVLNLSESAYFKIIYGDFGISLPDDGFAIELEEYNEPKGYQFDVTWENLGHATEKVAIWLGDANDPWINAHPDNTGRYTLDLDPRMPTGPYSLCVENAQKATSCITVNIHNPLYEAPPAKSHSGKTIGIAVAVAFGVAAIGVAGIFVIRFYKQKKWGDKSAGSYIPMGSDTKGYTAPKQT